MPSFYTTFEAARVLGVSLPTVVNWIKGRRIKAHTTPGGHRRIAREDLAAFMFRQGMPLPPELGDAAPSRRKVLVIAEPGPLREGAVRQLAAEGYAVEQSSPGFPAGVAAARLAPDVLVAFVEDAEGGTTLRGIRTDRELAAVPVVALAPGAWSESLIDAGCAAVLCPPLADGALVRAVAEAREGTLRGAPASKPRPRKRA